MNILESIFKTREQKLAELQQKIRARDEAVRAVALAKKLAKSLPLVIEEQERMPFTPHVSKMCAEEDAVPSAMVDNALGLQALRNLLKDLPEITAHWETRLNLLMGTKQ